MRICSIPIGKRYLLIYLHNTVFLGQDYEQTGKVRNGIVGSANTKLFRQKAAFFCFRMDNPPYD